MPGMIRRFPLFDRARSGAAGPAPRGSARALAALAVGVGVLLPGLQPAATAAPVADATTATRAASQWLSTVAPTGVLTTGGVPDWGLTADNVFAHAAGGRGPTAGSAAADQLETHLLDYASDPTGTGRGAGPIAKLLVVAVVQGRDVTDFGGWNLRSELLALMTTTPGPQLGRFQSKGVGDTTNGFSQSLGIIGLARSGSVPSDAISFLLAQQCPSGGFRLFFLGAGCTDDAAADVDATAMSIQALLAAKAAGSPGVDSAITDGLDWLEVLQGLDGSFTASGPSGVPNSQTTALSSQALRAGGRTDAADAASAWVRALQLDCDVVAPAGDRGAVAYGPDAYGDTVAGGVIDDMYADQFVRTTTEAALGMGAPSFATLSGTTTSVAPGGFDCDTPTTSSTTSTTTPGSTSTTAPGPTSTTTTSTPAPTSTTTSPRATSTTTIAVGLITATSSPDASVEGISQQSGGSGRAGTNSGSGLAVTGVGAGRLVASAALFALSGLLFVEARRRRR